MMPFALLLAQVAVTAPPAAEATPPPADVVVTGRPIAELKADWQRCIDEGCPPRQEIDRAIAYAAAQVVAGDYPQSYETLHRSKLRLLRHARELPVEVARLTHATARVAGLNGRAVTSRVGASDTVLALKAGLAKDDERVLAARLDIADAFVPEGRIDGAIDQYNRVAQSAREAALPGIYAEARYRRALLLVALVRNARTAATGGGREYEPEAQRALAEIVGSADPAFAPYRDLARLVAINLLPTRKQADAVDHVLQTTTPRSPDVPVLAYAPPLDFTRVTLDLPPTGEKQAWADIRYRIGANGRVSDISAVRTSPHLDATLLKVSSDALANRRYLPLALPSQDEGVVRYVRYTYVTDWTGSTGSRIVGRGQPPRVDIVDLGDTLTSNP